MTSGISRDVRDDRAGRRAARADGGRSAQNIPARRGVAAFLLALSSFVFTPLVSAQFTESAATVPPGEWLLEADLFNGGWQKTADYRFRSLGLGYVQWTLGWTEALDVQVGVQSYVEEKLTWRQMQQATERAHVHGDVTLRSKWRVLGDRESRVSVALLPALTVPLERDRDRHRFVSLALAVPISCQLNDVWCLDAQIQADGTKTDGEPRTWQWLAAANLQRAWNDRWGTYAEVVADFWMRRLDRPGVSGGLGVTRTFGSGLSGDVALYRGLTDEALDWELAVRLVWWL